MGIYERSSKFVSDLLPGNYPDASRTFGAPKHFRLVAALLVFSLALTLGLLLWSATKQDAIAKTGSRDLAETAIRVQLNSLSKTTTDYTYWDAAYENIITSFDEEWYSDEYGDAEYLQETFGVTSVFLVGPENRVIKHIHFLENIEDTSVIDIDSHVVGGFSDLIADARQMVDEEFEARAGLVKMAGQVFITAAHVIHPHTEEAFEKAAITPGNSVLLIFMRPLDEDLLAEIAVDFGLNSLVHVDEVDVPDGVSLPLLSVDGQSFGTLVWEIDLPSRFVLQVVLPGLLLVILFVGLLGWYVLRGIRRTQVTLAHREAQFKQAHEISRLGYWQTEGDDQVVISPELAAMLGMKPAREHRMPETGYYDRFVDDIDRERVRREWELCEISGARFESEYRKTDAEGREHWFREIGEPMLNRAGTKVGIAGTVQDITEIKQNEAHLRQVQKMEAVGQLTGGLAHDFNNLLAVIMGMAELLGDRLGDEDKPLNAILKAATRGSDLTQRLLAFSRRQSLNPEATDLGVLVSGMSDLLTRTLGATIEIETSAASDLWPALVDPSQVENTLLNLAINARDAMPDGGKLTIGCSNIHLSRADAARASEAVEGDYVVLTVSDNGTGIPPDILTKVFEPFFTTKEVGRGSGLGLSMVYGFAKQSGGHVTAESPLGEGTTIRLYLPRGKDAPHRKEDLEETDAPVGGDEAILVIEDDAQLREILLTALTRLGYRVFDFPDTIGARALLESGQEVDLMLSDVMLPRGASGPEFAKEVQETHPDMKIVFMSGYPAEAIEASGFVALDKVLIKKPFKRHELARIVREALG